MPNFDDVFLPDSLLVRSNRSPDAQVLTSIVQNLMVKLDAASTPSPPRTLADPPLAVCRSAMLLATLDKQTTEVTVHAKIQGKVELETGARIFLFSILSGKPFVKDLSGFAGSDFEFVHSARVNGKTGCVATLVLAADRSWIDGALPGAFASVNLFELTFS